MSYKFQIIRYALNTTKQLLWFVVLLLFSPSLSAQNIVVKLDTTTIKIGEEIKLNIFVEANPTDLIIFPEVKTMGLLEVINSYKIDTLDLKNQFILKKEYGLIQFDSGHYTLPPQKININGKIQLTDSLLIEVKDVVVDTTKQNLYDIKSIIKVEKPSEGFPKWAKYVLLCLIVLLAIFFFIVYKKSKTENKTENKLPPFEEAISQLLLLKEKENSLLNEGKHKEYYSQLTDVLKRYLDEEVYEDALESTSDELIKKLELLRNSGKFPISKKAIKSLQSVLQTSDLVKFAKSKPDSGTAKADRATIENILNETKAAIPEPTEEELWNNELYRLAQEKIQKRKKIIKIAAISLTILFLSILGLGIKYGFTNLKDEVFGHPSKELLERKWIRSEYGNPVVIITTPKVLKRTSNQQLEKNNTQSFAYGNINDNLAITINTVQIPSTVQMGVLQPSEEEEKEEIDLEQINEQTLQILEQQGATDIVLKQDDYEFPDHSKGKKAYGTLRIKHSVTQQKQLVNYEILTFVQENSIQQVLIFYSDDDKYAKKIAKRILNSVELKKNEK